MNETYTEAVKLDVDEKSLFIKRSEVFLQKQLSNSKVDNAVHYRTETSEIKKKPMRRSIRWKAFFDTFIAKNLK